MAKKLTSDMGNFKMIPIEQLSLADWNYKKFNDRKLQEKLVKNIKKNGQIENLIIREMGVGKYEVVNGNHRLLALKEIGTKEVACYNLGAVSLAQAKRIAVETNETKFGTDKKKLAEIVGDIVDAFDDFEDTTPFDDKEMDTLANMLVGEPESEDEEEKAPKEKPKKSQTMVSVSGENFKTIKLEVSPDLADRFNTLLKKLSIFEGSSERPLEVLVDFAEKFTTTEIEQTVGIFEAEKKRKKSVLKK